MKKTSGLILLTMVLLFGFQVNTAHGETPQMEKRPVTHQVKLTTEQQKQIEVLEQQILSKRKEVIEKMGHIKATFPFRARWGYTNAAFLTAGEIIPKVTGKEWEVFIKERIFDPLGMTRTLALSKDIFTATNAARAYTAASFMGSFISRARTSNAPRKINGNPSALFTWLG